MSSWFFAFSAIGKFVNEHLVNLVLNTPIFLHKSKVIFVLNSQWVSSKFRSKFPLPPYILLPDACLTPGARRFHAPPRHVNRFNSDSELIDDDNQVILPARPAPTSPARNPHHLVLGTQLHRREERSMHSLAGTGKGCHNKKKSVFFGKSPKGGGVLSKSKLFEQLFVVVCVWKFM